jgi:hypothetical protein
MQNTGFPSPLLPWEKGKGDEVDKRKGKGDEVDKKKWKGDEVDKKKGNGNDVDKNGTRSKKSLETKSRS